MVADSVSGEEEEEMLMAASYEKMMQIEDYAVRHSTPLSPLLEELVATTREKMGNRWVYLSGEIQGTFLQMLAASVGARRILEIGTFTGFSALMMAEALSDDGELITCEIDPEAIAFARSFFARSPHGGKIEIREGPALDTLKTLEGPFDLVYIDADHKSNLAYYEAALSMLAPNGIIAVDNVLWMGRILEPADEGDRALVAFNEHVQQDERVWNVILTMRDGIMLIRRK
jgi:caffeoyl-CoA O-methyltransferase